MRANPQILRREIAGEHILLPVGEKMNSFHGIMVLNGSGLLLWEALQEDCTEEDLVAAILAAYDVDAQTAAKDVREFIELLDQADILIK